MSSTHRSSSPIIHSVHFYDRDEALIQRLRSIVSSTIDNGNSALIVATQEHRRQLSAALEANGDPRGLEMGGRLTFLDADETLSLFMVDGLPDQSRFVSSVGELVKSAKRAAWNGRRGLSVFGEMVAILWERGNEAGALQLEALWNDLLSDRAFHLHCAYPRSLFASGRGLSQIRAICDSHSHVVGAVA
jgi:hypothetical protein